MYTKPADYVTVLVPCTLNLPASWSFSPALTTPRSQLPRCGECSRNRYPYEYEHLYPVLRKVLKHNLHGNLRVRTNTPRTDALDLALLFGQWLSGSLDLAGAGAVAALHQIMYDSTVRVPSQTLFTRPVEASDCPVLKLEWVENDLSG